MPKNMLRYSNGKRKNSRAQYFDWRAKQELPLRCDNHECVFYSEPLIWNGKPLALILDHKNGVNSDDRAKNLRLLCPNCDSQLLTRAGGNKGRVTKSEGGFAIRRLRDDKRDYFLPAEGSGQKQ
jgi:hypothetical protein